MDSQIEISDDDDSFNGPGCSTNVQNNPTEDVIAISSDEEFNKFSFDNDFMSDDEDSSVVVAKKKAAVKSLFSSKSRKGKGNDKNKQRKAAVKALFPQKQNVSVPVVKSVKTRPPIEPPKDVFNKMIEGVNVMLPVNPYGSQIALMSKIITAIKKKENCILESPTGSGKTLALLCGALAWQQHEQKQLGQTQAQHYFTKYPEIKKDGVADYISSPIHLKTDATPEKLFSKNNFGEKSIYYKPEENGESSSMVTRQEKTPYRQISEEESPCNQVTIHKRPRLGSGEYEDTAKFSLPHTPEKATTENNEKAETPESISLPTIYYGARTHTQIKQVVKEFKRTSYCGMMKMTLLSSRDKSCIKEFDRSVWSSRNDMCRACVKPIRRGSNKENSNCKFYDNRTALNHKCMPAAFDLEDLVEIGREKEACPYYGARAMAKTAHIVFCPYNYLIDPSIRSSLSIDLTGAVVIIDEAHNIEGICRDVASVDITQLQIQNAIKELETVSQYRFANQDVEYYIDGLLNTLNSWNYWFQNQIPLINQQPVNNNEAIYKWQQTADFVNTLNNHNIGYVQYADFKRNAESFCRRLREDASTLYGVTQATGTLLESMDMALGFLFRDHCQHMDDFKPLAANRRKQDDKNLEILRELISLNGNKYCLDCNQRGPTYVNSTIGSFVCSKCSGMLRGLTPPHRVKSISMATFTPEEIEFIKTRGNDYCRRVWLGLYEGESVNFTDEQSVKDFMSDKYEKKRYYLDSPAITTAPVNGSSTKNKPKLKTGSNASSAAPLISISPQTSKNTVNNNTVVQTAKVVNNLLPTNDLSYRVAQPVNNLVKPIMNTVNVTPVPAAVPASVPDFPVDFSTANIYNSSQINNNVNNSFATPPSMVVPAFNAFSTPPQPANDRYAALADLDMALRQQNMKHMEENNVVNNKNPFQSTTTNDLFASKNPFFNGGWSTTTTTVPVNPFMQSTNNGGFMNSKNPFL